jgi:uncharacterized RDD family membrane protein YckC
VDYEPLIAVFTPEGVEISYPLAGVGSRLVARMLDLVVWTVLAVPVVLAVVLGGLDAAWTEIVLVLGAFAILFGYDVLFEVYASGRTPGKRAIGLRVVEEDGRPVGIRGAALRSALWWIDGPASVLLVFVVSVAVTAHAQRLGDLAGGTVVVRERRGRAKAPAAIQDPGAPVAAALDTTAISDAQIAAVADFLVRRDQLLPAARTTLAAALADGLRPVVAGGVEAAGDPESFLVQLVAARRARD